MTEIAANDLRAFLQREGWSEFDADELGESWILAGADEAPAILIPTYLEGPSYEALLASAVSRVLWATGLTEQELLDSAVTTLTDTLEVRVVDPTTAAGRIPLVRGAQLAQSLRTIVANGARLQFAGGRVVQSGDLSAAARRVMDRLELAPPSAGSFRLAVQAPVYQQLSFQAEGAATDAIHETLASALRALDAAREIVESGIPDNAEELEDAVIRGVSTNLVKAVRDLDTQSSALRVEFRGCWSRPDPDAPEVVTLGSNHFSQLRRLEEVLKHFDPRSHYSLSGWIKGVGADALALDDVPRDVPNGR